ncbi:uncharacterized protein [Cherax quadricarinatus]|uniref:uncharacterized protein isoform X2 n=1 Tax=Cherax quadricarinatus TaxID=27406 RepID=UPI00387E379D
MLRALTLSLMILRWVWRLWLRSGAIRSFFIVLGFVIFTVHFLSLTKTSDIARGYDDDVNNEAAYIEIREIDTLEDIEWPREPQAFTNDTNLGPLDDWIEVEGSNRNFFLYSAYLDRRGKINAVRIIAIIKKREKVKECVVWTGDNIERVSGKSQLIRENWNLAYSAGYILCYLKDRNSVPSRVAVVLQGQYDEASSLPVQDLSVRDTMGNMSVCVKAFHYNFDRAVWLVEFIEFYRLLGADKFIFYNHTLGKNVERVLKYYQALGVATVLPWSLPVVTQVEIRTEGIFAALNDCNLRSVNRFHLAAMVDIDEFLIPRQHHNLLDLVGSYDRGIQAFIFQNIFFYLYWENDTAVHNALFADDQGLGVSLFGEESSMPYLLTAFKTRRLGKPHKHGQRSKYIVRPEAVVELGNHIIWEFVGNKPRIWVTNGNKKNIGRRRKATGLLKYDENARYDTSLGLRYNKTPAGSAAKGPKKSRNVPPDVGMSHHYRICEFGGFDCLKKENLVDRRAHNWLVPLVKSVANACTKIFPLLGKCPEAPPLGSPW